MGGYAAYVWSAFGFAVVVLLGLLGQSWRAAHQREAELAQVREEIGRLVAQLDDLSERAYGFQGALEKVALERRIQEQRVAEASAERDLAESRVVEAGLRLQRNEEDLAA